MGNALIAGQKFRVFGSNFHKTELTITPGTRKTVSRRGKFLLIKLLWPSACLCGGRTCRCSKPAKPAP